MHKSATFNIRDLTTYIEDKDEKNEYLRENLVQGAINVEPTTRFDLLI